MVMDCVVDLLISKPPPCLSGECWRQTATFLARKMVVVIATMIIILATMIVGENLLVIPTSLVSICSCPLV